MFGWRYSWVGGRMSVWVEVQLCGWKDECLGGGTVVWVEG